MEDLSLKAKIERYRQLLVYGPDDDGLRQALRELLAEAEGAMAATGPDPEVA